MTKNGFGNESRLVELDGLPKWFQIYHNEYGIFQGEFLGFAFWYPISDMPEQGLCKMTLKEVRETLETLNKIRPEIYNPKTTFYMEFDFDLDFRLSQYLNNIKPSN